MHPILDPGHGMQWARSGGRVVDLGDRVFYEGEFNRDVVNRLASMLTINRIPFSVTTVGHEDMSIGRRVSIANKIFEEKRDSLLISIHSNAGGGNGLEVLTSQGQTKSDKYATLAYEMLEKDQFFSRFRLREDYSDGDPDKEIEGLGLLEKSRCPSVLFEFLFFDNKFELENYLMAPHFRHLCAEFLYRYIIEAKGLVKTKNRWKKGIDT